MKIPIFEEILLKGSRMEDIRSIVDDSRIGKVPCYVNLSNYTLEDLQTTVMNLEQVILEAALHPRFPYPLYIIANKSIDTIFPTVRSVKDLPEHYFKKVKRPNNKELQLLNKLSLKVDKIKNLQLYKMTEELRNSADTQRRLYNETKELFFLENLNFVLYEKHKVKNKDKDRKGI
jgi:hypothetical protein